MTTIHNDLVQSWDVGTRTDSDTGQNNPERIQRVTHFQLLMSVRNSSRVFGSSRNTPNIVLVTVLLFIFCTPRITIHMCLGETRGESVHQEHSWERSNPSGRDVSCTVTFNSGKVTKPPHPERATAAPQLWKRVTFSASECCLLCSDPRKIPPSQGAFWSQRHACC